MIWRLRAEDAGTDRAAVERLDRRAHKLVAGSLFALATYVAIDAGRALWTRDQPEASMVGIALTTVSMSVMAWLARAQRRAAALLESRALEAASFQTALVMVGFILKEARGGWRGEECRC